MTRTGRQAAIVVLAFTLQGCVSSGEPAFKPSTNVTGTAAGDKARDRARIHTELASSYYELANMGVALEEVREALRADAEYGPAHNLSGLIYAELKEDKLAHESFQRALRIDPLDSDANNNYG